MKNNPVVLFDGVCNLCSSSVQFIIKNDSKNYFYFASLQSDFGQNILKKNELNYTDFNSFILLNDNNIYQESTAALQVVKHLKFPINMLFVFIVVPRFIRDFVYQFIAKNRYKWFGKKNECWIPSPHLKEKFID